MPLARRMSNSSVASASSHQSFPATANSSTKVSKAKVGKIMTRRKTTRHTAMENQTTVDKENGENVLMSPTPYWKVAKERGTNRETPPNTRSHKKRKTDRETDDTRLMLFSPPDQEANSIREREENERKLRARASRVENARNRGQLLVFSPTFRNPALLPPDLEGENHNDEPEEEKFDFKNEDTGDIADSQDESNTTPSNMEVEVSGRESENSQLSVSTSRYAVDKNAEEIKNELKFLRETLDQFVAGKSRHAEVQQHYSSLEAQMLRTEQVLVENSKLQLKIASLEDGMKEKEAKATNEQGRLNNEIVELQNKLYSVSGDAESHLEALKDVKAELTEHAKRSLAEKEALLHQIQALRAELDETKARLVERQGMCVALKEEIDAERRAITTEHKMLLNSQVDLQAEIQELSMTNNALNQTIFEYESKIDTLEKSLLPESKAELEKALTKLKYFEENEVGFHEELSSYQRRIDEISQELKQAREEQAEERKHFQQLNQESSKAYHQIQQTIAEKDEIIQGLRAEIDETSEALALESIKLKDISNELASARADMDTRTQELEELLVDVKSQLEASTKEKEQLEQKLGVTLEQMRENAAFKEDVLARSNETSAANKILTQRIEQLMLELHRSKSECDATKTRLETFNQREAKLFEKLQESDRVRRSLHNRVMQLSGNIRVYVRVRPTIPGEENEGAKVPEGQKKRKHRELDASTPFTYPGFGGNEDAKSSLGADDPTKNLLEVREPWTDRGGLRERRKTWTFGFDSVFTPSHGQSDIWEATEPLVQSAIDGYNVTVFAYGQTGSGKTYTMLGESGNEGIVSRSIKMLFLAKESIAELTRGKSKVEISVELLEIYNEKVRDLLISGKPEDQNLKVKANQAVGSTVLPVDSENEVFEILQTAQSRRCVKATASNAVSSRSHMLFTLHFKVITKSGKTRVGRLNVCDLAGSERLGKSNANETVGGALLTETKHINTSLSVLSNVIEKLQSGDSNVPYRESKLTHLLQNSLGGNSKTLAIVCCNPLQSHFHESLCSLRFAAKVNKVDLKAVANFSA